MKKSEIEEIKKGIDPDEFKRLSGIDLDRYIQLQELNEIHNSNEPIFSWENNPALWKANLEARWEAYGIITFAIIFISAIIYAWIWG